MTDFQRARFFCGHTLIEIIVSLLIFLIGLLALLYMQLVSLHLMKEAETFSIAAQEALNSIEKITTKSVEREFKNESGLPFKYHFISESDTNIIQVMWESSEKKIQPN